MFKCREEKYKVARKQQRTTSKTRGRRAAAAVRAYMLDLSWCALRQTESSCILCTSVWKTTCHRLVSLVHWRHSNYKMRSDSLMTAAASSSIYYNHTRASRDERLSKELKNLLYQIAPIFTYQEHCVIIKSCFSFFSFTLKNENDCDGDS